MSLLEDDRQLIEVAQASIQLDLALVEPLLAIKEKKKQETREERGGGIGHDTGCSEDIQWGNMGVLWRNCYSKIPDLSKSS